MSTLLERRKREFPIFRAVDLRYSSINGAADEARAAGEVYIDLKTSDDYAILVTRPA